MSTPTNASGTITKDTEVTYYYRLKSFKLTVHHYKEGTTEKLGDDQVSTKKYNDSYTTSVLSKIPEGYELVSTPTNASGTITKDTVVTYYYRLKSFKLTVHHYKEGTTEKLGDDQVSTKKYNDSYTTSVLSNIPEGYELVSTPTNASGTITKDTVVTYYYRLKSFKLTVHHYKEGTTEKLGDDQVSTKKYNDSYTTSVLSKIPEGYELVSTPTNATGTIKKDTEVTYYYRLKSFKLTVHHYIEGTTEKLVEDDVSSKKYGDEYTTSKSNKVSSYYEIVSTPENATGIIKNDTVVTYYYKLKNYNLTVHHYKEGTTEKLAEDDVSSKKYGDEYTTSKSNKVSSHYEIVSTPENATGTIKKDTVVTYYYKLKNYNLTVHHYKEGTTEKLGQSTTEVKKALESYTTDKLASIPEGYELVSTPTNASGTITDNTVVIYYYKLKDFNLIVHHYKEGTTEKLVEDDVTSKKYGDEYKTSKSYNVSKNYEIVSTPENATGTITKDTVVTYYYKLREGTLTVRHLMEGTGKVLSKDLTKNVHFGDEYETVKASDIPQNYILKETPDNYKGIIEKEKTEVIYYYQKKDSNIIPTITKDGTDEITRSNEKLSYEIKFNVEFQDYIDKATITLTDKLPYKIDVSKSNLNGGTYDENNQTIIWQEQFDINSYAEGEKSIVKNIEVVYINLDPKVRTITNEIIGDVQGDNKNISVSDKHNTNVKIPGNIILRYIDKEANKDILEKKTFTDLVGENYKLPEDEEIEGYILTHSPEVKEYEYKEQDQVIVYYYERIKLNVETKIKTNGGVIEGDEVVYYGDDSSKDKIRIRAEDNFYIDKVWINGEEIEVADKTSTLILSNFPEINENKLVEVSFKPREVVKVPLTSSFVSKFIVLLGIIALEVSLFVMYKLTKAKKAI